ncbi:MAG: hypothetical protein AAFY34_05855 [Pseudomonadota bacterium]
MNKPSLAEDIAFARAMAEEGATAPSLSGRFAVMWGTLATLALVTHWAIVRQILPIEPAMIGLVWLTMMILGTIGTLVLKLSLRDKPGLSTAGNKAEAAGWPIVNLAIFGIVIAIAISVIVRGQPTVLFDMIIPIAFALYAVMIALSAKLFGTQAAHWRVMLALVLSVITAALLGMPEIYLLAAAGNIAIQIIPGFASLRAEPKAIV